MTNKTYEKSILLKLTKEQHKMIKLKAVQLGITLTELILLAISKINGGTNDNV